MEATHEKLIEELATALWLIWTGQKFKSDEMLEYLTFWFDKKGIKLVQAT
jgi:hypothetical protein